jgi:hypothetical protein
MTKTVAFLLHGISIAPSPSSTIASTPMR